MATVTLPVLQFNGQPVIVGDLKQAAGSYNMNVRPRDLSDRISGIQQPEKFTLPIDAARLKAREIIDQFPQAGYMAVVENWRQLPNGQIEFTMRRLPTAD